MEATYVTELLQEANIEAPSLVALDPATGDYSVLMLQPHGAIIGSVDPPRIGNFNSTEAATRVKAFLNLSLKRETRLVMAPEYSVPWESLEQSFADNIRPPSGSLWILGMESITPEQLEELFQRLTSDHNVFALRAKWDESLVKSHAILDPLVYVFCSETSEGESKLVVLVQFKMVPSADRDEANQLILGTSYFVFNAPGQIKLLTLLCSDVLDPKVYSEAIFQHADRALIIHLQLNPKPRDRGYINYRKQLFEHYDDETELVCLNWEKEVKDYSTGEPKDWGNVAGSAWYLHNGQVSVEDADIENNHKHGLYYCRSGRGKNITAYVFNFDASVYELKTSKVRRVGGTAAVRRRRGPKMENVYSWDESAGDWEVSDEIDDAFNALAGKVSDEEARAQLERIYQISPLFIERFFALTFNETEVKQHWYDVRNLSYFELAEDESLRRVSFAQDFLASPAAHRSSLIKSYKAIYARLKNAKWPPSVKHLSQSFEFSWTPDYPATNLRSTKNGKRGLFVYIGEEPDESELKSAYFKAFHLTSLAVTPNIPAQIVYSENAETKFYEDPDRVDIRARYNPLDLTSR